MMALVFVIWLVAGGSDVRQFLCLPDGDCSRANAACVAALKEARQQPQHLASSDCTVVRASLVTSK